ncbi:MAG TPA: hypothetical protein VM370_04585 [Candidatus Thermoplasmatota archaeon]|nr:hypothetical protein [Candidatus Thermoplasmatota archaeon]
MRAAIALAILLVAGCLRVGSGDDLHLVCEEKSGSPRKAYGIDFLVAQTRTDGSVPAERKLALLEAARQHVVTLGGREHAAFDATLGSAPAAADGATRWSFHAVGVRDSAEPDVYDVELRLDGDRATGAPPAPTPGPVAAPRSLVEPAWAAANATREVTARAGANATLAWASWDPDLPSCVELHLGAADATVNVLQSRVVDIR